MLNTPIILPSAMANLGNGRRTRESYTPATASVLFGAGWNQAGEGQAAFDVDIAWVMYTLVAPLQGIVICHQLHEVSRCKSVFISGDNPDGFGEGWDEYGGFNPKRLPADCLAVEGIAYIRDAVAKGQHFGQLTGGYVSVIDSQGNPLKDGHRAMDHEQFAGSEVIRVVRLDRTTDCRPEVLMTGHSFDGYREYSGVLIEQPALSGS